jgi:hypothetical protein
MAYNGDLIQHIGSNPSGQNLTVYINSIVNSLLFRCAFYNLKGLQTKRHFRDICKLMTYGDDVKGSVKKGHDDFNHLYVAKFFAEHDMKFTMPDKESTPTPFMKDCDADFLKRKNVFCPETGFIMGALDEDSIFKSLHSNLKSKANTREKLAADNIDGALREWFNHGRETYEFRRAQMQEVAVSSNIDHICTQLDKDFDYQVEHWKDRYLRGVIEEEPEEEESFEVQAGEYVPEPPVDLYEPYQLSEYDRARLELYQNADYMARMQRAMEYLDVNVLPEIRLERQNAFEYSDESSTEPMEDEFEFDEILPELLEQAGITFPTHAAAA